MNTPTIRHVRAFTLRGAGADYHDQDAGHWIDDHIATPMAKYPQYRQSRQSFGLNVLAPPDVQVRPGDEDGPIAVQVDYRIREQDRAAFLEAMTELGRSRRRDGALFWRIYRDLGDPHRYAERFVVRSWTDYLRQRARATAADRAIEQRAWQLHVGDDAPDMQHMLAEKIPDAD